MDRIVNVEDSPLIDVIDAAVSGDASRKDLDSSSSGVKVKSTAVSTISLPLECNSQSSVSSQWNRKESSPSYVRTL